MSSAISFHRELLKPSHHIKYLYILCLVFILFFMPIFLCNVYLNYINLLSNVDLDLQASEWQDKTQGIACTAYANEAERKFKAYRLRKVLSQKDKVNTISFGSSTAMGIKESMFPKHQKLYNFSLSANPTEVIATELNTLVDESNVSHFIVSLDWAWKLTNPNSVQNVLQHLNDMEVVNSKGLALWINIMKDSMTTSKVKMFLNKFWLICISNDRLKAFKDTFSFYQDEYSCPDGQIAKDFNALYPKKCAGFYPDGARNYLFFRPSFSNGKEEIYAENFLNIFSSRIQQVGSYDIIKDTVLIRFSEIIKKIQNKNADIFFILPPLAPGVEKKLLESKHGPEILKLKNKLHEFSFKNNVQILDLGQSEKYGCQSSDFMDEHHAIHTCYEKMIPLFLSQRDKLGFGIVSLPLQNQH